MSGNTIYSWNEKRRGAVLVMAALLMVPLLAFVAFAIDCGYIALVKGELQNAADAAAKAGAHGLADSPAAAKAAAAAVAAANQSAGNPVLLVPAEDIELGTWDEDTATFTPVSGSAENNANAVRVTCWLRSDRGNQLNLFFASVIGHSETDVRAQAVARVELDLCGPFIGVQQVTMGNAAYTNSYNSDEGSYPAALDDNGDLCSDGPITMTASAVVNGDAHPGEGYTVSTGGSSQVTGSKSPRTEQLNLPAVDPGNVATSNDNNGIPISDQGKQALLASGEFKLTGGDHVTLAPGIYYFGKFTLSGGSSISTTGPTVIYCTGSVSISGGGIVNATQKPANLQVYGTGPTCTFAGSSQFYGVVYAPASDVERGGSAEFFGMIVGKTLTLSGSGGLHYDESLGPWDFQMTMPSRSVLTQ